MSFRSRIWLNLARFKLSKSLGVSLTAGASLAALSFLSEEARMVAPYAFGGHFEGSSSYPKKPIIPQDCVIVGGSGNKKLAEDIAATLGCKLLPIETGKFRDGETYVKFDGSIEGKHVMLICSQGAPANDTVFETLLLISSLKRNGAKSISLYMPYAAYARQDKMVGPWRSLGFSDLSTYYQASGVDRVVTLDIHNEAVMGCFTQNVNATNLTSVNLAAKYLTRIAKLNNLVVLSPDEGGVKRAKKFFDEYQHQPDHVNRDTKFMIMLKHRERPNEVASMTVNGDVSGRACILVDDMIDTGGTMMKAAKMLKEKGATHVYVFATHGIFNDNFFEKLEASMIDKVFVTNSLAHPETEMDKTTKIQKIPVSKLFADHIYKNSMSCP